MRFSSLLFLFCLFHFPLFFFFFSSFFNFCLPILFLPNLFSPFLFPFSPHLFFFLPFLSLPFLNIFSSSFLFFFFLHSNLLFLLPTFLSFFQNSINGDSSSLLRILHELHHVLLGRVFRQPFLP
ncbi:hypothetical protein B0T13DRAFT_283200 [Neurospora crassa]|nr:hypothetical protein B0T13DRAFT_283200 [Neurospora crassa]